MFILLSCFKSGFWLICHQICQPYPSKRCKIVPFVSMPSGTGHPPESAACGGFPWGSPRGPARQSFLRYLSLAMSRASLTVISHRFSMETGFMRKGTAGRFGNPGSPFRGKRCIRRGVGLYRTVLSCGTGKARKAYSSHER